MRMTTRVFAAVIAVSLLGLGSAWSDGQIPTVRDVARIVKLSDPHFSPDGKTLVYVETRANLDSDEYESEIELIAASGGEARPLTRRHHVASPRWSPSGDRRAAIGSDFWRRIPTRSCSFM
jgi:dipeptidyl aminopeptidase/acylaminoacyl peptidase